MQYRKAHDITYSNKFDTTYKSHAAKLRTFMSKHNDQVYGKSIMTSHEIIDQDKGAKMLII